MVASRRAAAFAMIHPMCCCKKGHDRKDKRTYEQELTGERVQDFEPNSGGMLITNATSISTRWDLLLLRHVKGLMDLPLYDDIDLIFLRGSTGTEARCV